MFKTLKGLGDAITEGVTAGLRLFAKEVEANPLLLAPKARKTSKEGYRPVGTWEAMFTSGHWQFWNSPTGPVVSGPALVHDNTGITAVDKFLVQLTQDKNLQNMLTAADNFPGRPGPILNSL